MCIPAGCFPLGCISTLPIYILENGGPLGVGVDLSVFSGEVVAGVSLPPVAVECITNNLFVCFVCTYNLCKHSACVLVHTVCTYVCISVVH